MGIVIRQSIIGTILGYAGVGIGFMNAVIFMPKFMTVGEIGLWRTLFSSAMFLLPLSLIGSQSAITRFLPSFSQRERKTLVTTLLFYVFITFCLLIIGGVMLRPTLHIVLEGSGEVFQNHFHYVIILLGLMTVYTFLESIYKANLDITSPNFVREVVYKTAHLLIILLYGFDLINFDWYLNCQLIIYTIMVSILIIKNCSRHYFTLGIPFKLNRRKSLQILKYCLFAILNSLGIALFMRIDNLMIAEYIGLQEVGIYTTAIYFTSVILIPIRYIEQISSPLISKAFSNNQIGEVSKYYKSSSINQLLITTFIFSLIVFNLNEIYAIMPNGTVYSSGALVVYIAGCTSIIDAGFGLNGAILQMSKFYRFSTLILFIFGAMNVWLNFQLIPHFGLEGPAIATLVTFLMFNVTRSALLFAKLRLTNFTIKSLWTILLAVLLITSAYFANPSFENPFIGILIKSSILLIIFSIYVFIVKPSEEIQSMIEKALKKIKP